jgi:hypothetical protein
MNQRKRRDSGGKRAGSVLRRRLKGVKEAGGGESGREGNEAKFDENGKSGSMPKWEKVVEVGKGME